MEHGNDFLIQASIYFAAAVLAVGVAHRLGLGSVAGYLIAGIAIGPWGFKLIDNVNDVRRFAEIGVVFLLFVIGLELEPRRLWAMRVRLLSLGLSQVAGSIAAIGAAAWALGTDLRVCLVAGMALALSSTALALQPLRERGALGTPSGQASFAILLFQDLAVIPMLALLPLLGTSGEDSSFSWPGFAFAMIVIAATLIGGHFLARPVFRGIAKTRQHEVFTACGASTSRRSAAGIAPCPGNAHGYSIRPAQRRQKRRNQKHDGYWRGTMTHIDRPEVVARRAALAAGLLVGIALVLQPAPASAAEGDFLKGETVRFLVGYSPGGGYDTYARMLAPHFEKLTGATVVVENRPGGGGTTALNQLFRAKPDGLSMQMLNGESAVIAQLTKQPGVAYDMSKVSIYGRVLEEPHFMIVNPKLPNSLKEIIASGKKIKFSAGSRTDNLGDYAAVTCEALKMNCQIITGYKGSKEAGLAVMNGEADALTISESSAINYSDGGRTKMVVTIGRKRSAKRPDIPTVYEMFQLSPEGKWWFDFRLGIKAIGRSVVGTPGIPQDRLQYLQKVWRQILTDPAVITQGAKTSHDVDYESPDKLNIKELLERLPADKLKEVNEVILKKFS